ncbi:MAG: two-component regulator propeller domain-containing protein [bacterium]
MKSTVFLQYIRGSGFVSVALILMLLLILATILHAQKRNIKFERFSIEQGLSQNTVNCIVQDSRGFMWFGTQDGLNQYDGYRFTVFKHDPENPNSLSDNFIYTIYEDKSGVLWIGTDGGGLNRFDREQEKFRVFKHEPTNSNSLSNDRVLSIFEDQTGVLWIGTDGAD